MGHFDGLTIGLALGLTVTTLYTLVYSLTLLLSGSLVGVVFGLLGVLTVGSIAWIGFQLSPYRTPNITQMSFK